MKMPIEFHFIPVYDNMYFGLKESAGSSGRISRFSNPNSVEAASTGKRKAARTRLRNIKSYAKVTSIASYTWLATKYPARPPSKQNISSGFGDDAMIPFSFRFVSDRSSTIQDNAKVHLPLNNVKVMAKRGSFGCLEIALMST